MKGRITLLPGHGPESVAPEHDENEKTRERLFPIAPNLTGNGRTDRERLLEWVETLTEDERYLYDQFGFKFKALQSICARPDIIALPGEEATPEQYISFQDFLELLEEVHTDTKTIMGERLRHQNPVAGELRSFYVKLENLIQKNWEPGDYNNDYFCSAAEAIPGFKRLVNDPEVFRKVCEHLNLEVQESSLLGEALQQIRAKYEKIKDGESVEKSDIEALLSALGDIHFVRHAPSSEEKPTDRGWRELYKLAESLQFWKGSLEKTGEFSPDMQPGYIEQTARAIEQTYPERVTPLIAARHRMVREKRLQEYKNLAQIVDGIEDPKTRKLIQKILLQISTILTYLDHMMGMHETIEMDRSSQFIYPKQMLLYVPLITHEIQHLVKGLQDAALEQHGKKVEEVHFASNEIDNRELSQPGFKIAAESSEVAAQIETVLEGGPGNKPDAARLAEHLDSMSFLLNLFLRQAHKNMRETKLVEETPKGNVGDVQTVSYQTLSYHIQDFITELNSGFMQAIADIANLFDPDGKKNMRRDIIPEYRDYEEQAAGLRLNVAELGQACSRTMAKLEQLRVTDTAKVDTAPLFLAAKEALRQLGESTRKFQDRRDEEISNGNYYAILKGEMYYELRKFTESISEFFLQRKLDALDVRTLATQTVLNDLQVFGEGVEATPGEKTTSVKEWIKGQKEVRKAQYHVNIGHKSGELDEGLKAQYRSHCLQSLEQIRRIAEEGGEGTDVFQKFVEEHPYIRDIHEDDFNDQLYAFQKLINFLKEFKTFMETPSADMVLLNEFDVRVYDEMVERLTSMEASLNSGDISQYESGAITVAMQECSELNQHLEITAPELAGTVHDMLNYLSQLPRYLRSYNDEARASDFETVLATIQYLKENFKKLKAAKLPK